MTVPMLMMPPPAVRSRFSDWPLALRSILGFWCFYALTVVLRALLAPTARNEITAQLINIGLGIVITGCIYLAIAGIGRAQNIRAKTIIAAICSVIAAMVMAGTLSL